MNGIPYGLKSPAGRHDLAGVQGRLIPLSSDLCAAAVCLRCAGFMVSRMLGVAPTIADAIIDQLSRPSDKAVAAGALLIRLGLLGYTG